MGCRWHCAIFSLVCWSAFMGSACTHAHTPQLVKGKQFAFQERYTALHSQLQQDMLNADPAWMLFWRRMRVSTPTSTQSPNSRLPRTSTCEDEEGLEKAEGGSSSDWDPRPEGVLSTGNASNWAPNHHRMQPSPHLLNHCKFSKHSNSKKSQIGSANTSSLGDAPGLTIGGISSSMMGAEQSHQLQTGGNSLTQNTTFCSGYYIEWSVKSWPIVGLHCYGQGKGSLLQWPEGSTAGQVWQLPTDLATM